MSGRVFKNAKSYLWGMKKAQTVQRKDTQSAPLVSYRHRFTAPSIS